MASRSELEADIREAAVVRVEGGHLVIDAWHAGRGVSRRERH